MMDSLNKNQNIDTVGTYETFKRENDENPKYTFDFKS